MLSAPLVLFMVSVKDSLPKIGEVQLPHCLFLTAFNISITFAS